MEDRNQNMSELVHDLADGSKIGARKTERIRDELADGSKIGAGEHGRIRDELADGSTVETR